MANAWLLLFTYERPTIPSESAFWPDEINRIQRAFPSSGLQLGRASASVRGLISGESAGNQFVSTTQNSGRDMAYLNDNYLKLKAGYLFPEIARRVKAFCDAHPDAAKRLIRCGIGDVTEPLPGAVIEALHQAVDEMARRDTFRG